jgi:hypothetical protein
MAKLLISLMALVGRVKRGDIDQVDLDHGIYYLGCTRMEALAPFGESTLTSVWLPQDDLQTKKRVFETVSMAIIKADTEGRVMWKERGALQSYEALNKLLDRTGFGKIEAEYTDDAGSYHPAAPYSCPGVAARVRAAGLDLDVVY